MQCEEDVGKKKQFHSYVIIVDVLKVFIVYNHSYRFSTIIYVWRRAKSLSCYNGSTIKGHERPIAYLYRCDPWQIITP